MSLVPQAATQSSAMKIDFGEKMLATVDSFKTQRTLCKIEPYKARGFIAEWPVA